MLTQTTIDVSLIPLSILRPVHMNIQRLTRGVSHLSKINILTIGDFIKVSPLHLIQTVPQFGAYSYQEICSAIDQYFKFLNIDLTFNQLYHSTHLNNELKKKGEHDY